MIGTQPQSILQKLHLLNFCGQGTLAVDVTENLERSQHKGPGRAGKELTWDPFSDTLSGIWGKALMLC